MGIVLALLIFSAIILFHEFGHFLLAKLNRVTVVEFSLGMGPRLLSFERGGTRYSLKLLPFGGSCMMLGEDDGDGEEGSFAQKKVWQRILIVAAGPLFNFILAFVLSVILVVNAGYDEPVVSGVADDFPAQEAGIEAGDRIISIGGSRVYLYREVMNYVTFHQDLMQSGEAVPVVWEHEGRRMSAEISARDNGAGRYVFGIAGSPEYKSPGIVEAFQYGMYEVRYWIRLTFSSLGMLVRGQVSLNDMSGPVGVVDMIDETYESSRTDGTWYIIMNMLNIAILLSANLGVMNLLPLPALDGGRLLFMLVELVRRKRLDPEIEGRIHMAGLMLLLVLMVVILFNDVRKIFV